MSKKHKSPSSWWRQYFVRNTTYKDNSDRKKRNQQRVDQVLEDLARTVNIVLNTEENKDEEALRISWAQEGDINSSANNNVYLSPDIVLNKPEEEDINSTDILTGKALTLSKMKKTVSPLAEKEAAADIDNKDPLASSSSILWQAKEYNVAREDVLENWQGFKGYFDCLEEEELPVQEHLQAILDNVKMDLELASHTLAWNLQNPDNQVRVSPEYQSFFDTCLKEMQAPRPASTRYQHARDLARAIQRVLKIIQKQQKNQGEGDKEGEMSAGQRKQLKADKQDQLTNDQAVEGSTLADESEDMGQDPNDLNSYKINRSVGLRALEVEEIQPTYPQLFFDTVLQNQGAIKQVTNSLSFRITEKTKHVYGLKAGELDEGNLYKLSTSHPEDIWSRKEKITKPKVAVCLLIDESGSMSEETVASPYRPRFYEARRIAIILSEAFKNIPGLDFQILGHTADVSLKCRRAEGLYRGITVERNFGVNKDKSPSMGKAVKTIRKGSRPQTGGHPSSDLGCLNIQKFLPDSQGSYPSLSAVTAIGNNADGYALEYAAKSIAKEFPEAHNRYVIHLSDGRPSSYIYDTIEPQKHMRKIVQKASSNNLAEIYSIGVDNAYDPERGVAMYGPDRSVVIGDVSSALNIITSFLKRVLSKA